MVRLLALSVKEAAISNKERAVNRPIFYAQNNAEHADSSGVKPKYRTYLCGTCGNSTTGRTVSDMIRGADHALISWCVCSCEKNEPTVFVEKDGTVISQLPVSREFHAGNNWPSSLAGLYEEAAKSYSASAFTATAMLCRKLLMACACEAGDTPGKNFDKYVDYIITTVLPVPSAKASIDAIRTIGNEANHEIHFVAEQDAKRAMDIVTYMLNAIYSLPAA